MAWVEQRGERFREVFRYQGNKFYVRSRLAVPGNADFGLFPISDGKLERSFEVARSL